MILCSTIVREIAGSQRTKRYKKYFPLAISLAVSVLYNIPCLFCLYILQVEIREGSIVRLKIIGLVIDAGSISAIGTIKENYLGLLEM